MSFHLPMTFSNRNAQAVQAQTMLRVPISRTCRCSGAKPSLQNSHGWPWGRLGKKRPRVAAVAKSGLGAAVGFMAPLLQGGGISGIAG